MRKRYTIEYPKSLIESFLIFCDLLSLKSLYTKYALRRLEPRKKLIPAYLKKYKEFTDATIKKV